MNKKYDEKLTSIPHFSVHNEMLPFVGEDYDKYRVLHVGESHYICLNKENEQKYNMDYFKENWFSNKCEEILQLDEGAYNTRKVIEDYIRYGMSGGRRYFRIFQNVANAFVDSGLVEENNYENKRDIYENMVFMNFFQMPSLYEGKSFYDSLSRNASFSKISPKEMWEYSVTKSIKVFDEVIDILEPRLIVFTSILAGNAYKKNHGKFYDSSRTLYLDHPTSPYWNRCKRGKLSSRKQLEMKLKAYCE